MSMNDTLKEEIKFWHEVDVEDLTYKLEDGEAKLEKLNSKLKAWKEANQKDVLKEARRKVKTYVNKSLGCFDKLCKVGDDFCLGAEENLMYHRMERLLRAYLQQYSKLKDSLEFLEHIEESYPVICASCDLDKKAVMPTAYSDPKKPGLVFIQTLAGVKPIKFQRIKKIAE